jgi:hypothetical protein
MIPQSDDKQSDIHTLPIGENHTSSVNCFCEPTIYYVDEITNVRCFMHKSKDELTQ